MMVYVGVGGLAKTLYLANVRENNTLSRETTGMLAALLEQQQTRLLSSRSALRSSRKTRGPMSPVHLSPRWRK